jgi:hypothetical protein
MTFKSKCNSFADYKQESKPKIQGNNIEKHVSQKNLHNIEKL